MISIREIEKLFSMERYSEASVRIRESLQEMSVEDEDYAELLYYLFLADNRDYANIDLHDIVNEIEFNKALELAVLRLKSAFTAEYNFYKAVDVNLRKYFAYAARGNLQAFGRWMDEYGIHPAVLINDFSDEKEFFSNLDYLVTCRVRGLVVDLNLLALSILYQSTGENHVLRVLEVLRERAEEIGTRLAHYDLPDFDSCRRAYDILLADEVSQKAYRDPASCETITSEPLKEERHEEDIPTPKREEEAVVVPAPVYEEEKPRPKMRTESKTNSAEINKMYDGIAQSGFHKSLYAFISSIVAFFLAIILEVATMGLFVIPLILMVMLIPSLFLGIRGVIFSKRGWASDNRRHNGSLKGMIFGFISFAILWVDYMILFITFIVFMAI